MMEKAERWVALKATHRDGGIGSDGKVEERKERSTRRDVRMHTDLALIFEIFECVYVCG